jgi:uncharacterized RDD family membrane protein YckC
MDFQYSAIWRRAAAALIDGIILFVLTGFLGRIYLFPLSLILHMIYKPIFESSRVRATPGKYLAEISVCKSNGDQLDLKSAYIRYASSWLSGAIIGLGYVFAFFNPRKQTLHDMFADTIVVDRVYENNGLWNEYVEQFKKLVEAIKGAKNRF